MDTAARIMVRGFAGKGKKREALELA